MKWTYFAFIASLLAGYYVYDEFDPGVLSGKNVVITGGSAGIGEQIAYHYARMGARILITSRTAANLQKVVERCKEEGSPDGVYLYHAADMADPDSAAELIQAAEERLGGIDYLVLNHITPPFLGRWLSTAENMTFLEKTININFLAYVRLASSAMELLQRSNGSIVVVSSVVGKMAQPYIAPYASSKFALDGFFSALRQELYIDDIDVSITVCYIGLTDTASGTKALRQFGAETLLSVVSMALPEDVAYAIVRGAALQQRSVYYPYFRGRVVSVAYQFVPCVFEKIGSMLFARS